MNVVITCKIQYINNTIQSFGRSEAGKGNATEGNKCKDDHNTSISWRIHCNMCNGDVKEKENSELRIQKLIYEKMYAYNNHHDIDSTWED